MSDVTAACPECGETELTFIRTVCKRCYLRHWRAGTHHGIAMKPQPPRGPGSIVRTSKTCSRCHIEKQIDEFPHAKSRADLRAGHCKACHRAKYDPVRYRAGQMLRRYGITVAEFGALLERQGGGCAICTVEVNPDGVSLAVDHCHITGRVRGVLCGPCNKALGLFRDDPLLLEKAVSYLRR